MVNYDVDYDELVEKYFKNYDNVTWHDVVRVMKIVKFEYSDKIKLYDDKIKELMNERDEVISDIRQLRNERDELLSDLRQLKHALKDGDYKI